MHANTALGGETKSVAPSVPFPIVPLRSGAVAPDFELPDANDSTITLRELRGQPVVLAFAAPGWNPARAEQLALYNEIVTQVQPHGARLLGLEVEGIWYDLDFDHEKLRFPLLSDFDPEGAVARAYGVYGAHALFVIDAEGIIRWSHVLPVGVPLQAEAVVQVLDSLRELQTGPTSPAKLAQDSTPVRFNLTRREFVVAAMAAALALAVKPTPVSAQPSAFAPGVTADPLMDSHAGTMPVTLQVNGVAHRLNLEPRVSLLDALRENIGLTGTKKGCNQGACGACTVLVNGERMNSCLTLAVMHEGDAITTIEGLGTSQLHPLQAAFIEHDGFQCGYCTSGQIVSAAACIREGHAGSEDQIRHWMSGNICRCGAYPNIVAAIQAVASGGQTPSAQTENSILISNGEQRSQA